MDLNKPLWRDEKAVKLLGALLSGAIGDMKPQIDPDREMGYHYPEAAKIVGVPDEELLALLEYLAKSGILKRVFSEKYICCPQCKSLNLTPGYCCVKCGSGKIGRGRILVHTVCQYAGVGEEFTRSGKQMCPKCFQELRTSGQDLTSLGVLLKCRGCGEVFEHPAIKWHCLKCGAVVPEDKTLEVDAYTYALTKKEDMRLMLTFEMNHKARLIKFLQERGFEVCENAKTKGRSGAEHTFDLLAIRDDGVVQHRIAVGIDYSAQEVGIDRVFSFDDKAYDCGIHDKLMVVMSTMKKEAEDLADQQKIKVIQSRDLDARLGLGLPQVESSGVAETFRFTSKSALVDYVKKRGYEAEQYAVVRGKSGADHTFDMLATRNDGVTLHRIAVGIEVSNTAVKLDRVFEFDDKAYDCSIQDKVLIVVPTLGPEGKRFAERQKIRVFEAKTIEP
jgi:ribosomal protein S27E